MRALATTPLICDLNESCASTKTLRSRASLTWLNWFPYKEYVAFSADLVNPARKWKHLSIENLSCHFSAHVQRSFIPFLQTVHTCTIYYFKMNEWIYSLDRITVSQAGTPRHDTRVRLPVSWKPINNWLRTTPCFRKKTSTDIIGYKLRDSCLISGHCIGNPSRFKSIFLLVSNWCHFEDIRA